LGLERKGSERRSLEKVSAQPDQQPSLDLHRPSKIAQTPGETAERERERGMEGGREREGGREGKREREREG